MKIDPFIQFPPRVVIIARHETSLRHRASARCLLERS
jgi:hypothetical protein